MSEDERRTSNRVPMGQPAVVRVRERQGDSSTYSGQIVNMSSSGILFESEKNFPVGKYIEVSLLWPVKLENDCQLKLVVSGRVVRSEESETAMTVDKREFRTAGRTFAESPAA